MLWIAEIKYMSMYKEYFDTYELTHTYVLNRQFAESVTLTVLGIRRKWWMDECPSIIILGQTISDLLGHIFGEVHMCHSRCASANSESISRHSQYK